MHIGMPKANHLHNHACPAPRLEKSCAYVHTMAFSQALSKPLNPDNACKWVQPLSSHPRETRLSTIERCIATADPQLA